MRTFIHRHLTYANVMATFAVFVALGGSAFAASYVITRSSQVKDGVITGADVKKSTLTGRNIRDASLSPADFSGSVRGTAGPQGVQGPKGDPGGVGPRGPSDLYTAYFGDDSLDANDTLGWTMLANRMLPATGPYFAYANAAVKNASASAKTLQCGLGWWTPDNDVVQMTLAPDQQAEIALSSGVSIPQGAPTLPRVHFDCQIVTGQSVGALEFTDIDVGALQVGALHDD